MDSLIWSNILIDVILVAIVCGGFIYGAKCGVVKVIEKPLKLLSSFVLAAVAAISLSSTVVYPAIQGPVVEKFSEYIVEACSEADEIPMVFKLMGVTKEALDSGAAEIAEQVVSPMVLILSVIITFFVTYLIGKLLLGIVFGLLNFILNIGFLKYVSRVVGAVAGLVVFFIIATLAANVFGICASLDLFKNVEFLDEFTGGHVFNFMIDMWSRFFGI